MEFKNDAEKNCYNNIDAWLGEIFGEFVKKHQERHVFGVQKGSAFAQIKVHPWGDDDAIVNVGSLLAKEVEFTPDLMEFLLKKNMSLLFGSFGIQGEDAVIFHHNIVGSTCDKQELRTSVMAVLSVADEYDDKIVSQWGGQLR